MSKRISLLSLVLNRAFSPPAFDGDAFMEYILLRHSKAELQGMYEEMCRLRKAGDDQRAAELFYRAQLVVEALAADAGDESDRVCQAMFIRDSARIAAMFGTGIHDLLPVIFSGSGTDEAVKSARQVWLWLADAHRRLYCIAAWLEVRLGNLHPRVWSHILADTWTDGKAGSLLTTANIQYQYITAMFAAAQRGDLMSTAELATFDALPDQIIVYRGMSGVSRHQAQYGMSWTADKTVAAWFANRFANDRTAPVCLQAVVSKTDVFAYFKSEHEIVIRSGKARQVQVVPIQRQHVPWSRRGELIAA
jgi:hypothetical protein